MSAQRLRLIIFSLITTLGIFLPWINLKIKSLGMNSLKVPMGDRIIFMGIIVILIVLTVTGIKEKPLGWIKKISVTLLSVFMIFITIKYINDASSEYTSAGIGLYIMLSGEVIILVMTFLPERLFKCFAHKFITAPKA